MGSINPAIIGWCAMEGAKSNIGKDVPKMINPGVLWNLDYYGKSKLPKKVNEKIGSILEREIKHDLDIQISKIKEEIFGISYEDLFRIFYISFNDESLIGGEEFQEDIPWDTINNSDLAIALKKNKATYQDIINCFDENACYNHNDNSWENEKEYRQNGLNDLSKAIKDTGAGVTTAIKELVNYFGISKNGKYDSEDKDALTIDNLIYDVMEAYNIIGSSTHPWVYNRICNILKRSIPMNLDCIEQNLYEKGYAPHIAICSQRATREMNSPQILEKLLKKSVTIK